MTNFCEFLRVFEKIHNDDFLKGKNLKIKIPATSANLGPGFDCLGVSLNLHNEIIITKAKISSVSIKGEGEDNIFLKKNNPFLRIFNEIYARLLNESGENLGENSQENSYENSNLMREKSVNLKENSQILQKNLRPNSKNSQNPNLNENSNQKFTPQNENSQISKTQIQKIQISQKNSQPNSKFSQNFRFEFTNRIPLSRGLGSSSAVIIGAVAAAYAMAEKKASRNEILNLALNYEKHPDNIAPAALGGFVCSIVEGGEVFSLKTAIDSDLRAVVLIPNAAMSTKKSRANLPKAVNFKAAAFNLAHASFLTACFLQRRYDLLKIASLDMLHQNARMKALPALFKVQKFALENGALMSVLSGSGSSFLSVAHKDDAANLAAKMGQKFAPFCVKMLEFDNKGFEIC